MEIEKSYNFRKISDQLTTSGIISVESLKQLARLGYDVVVNLLPEDHEHFEPAEKLIVESQSIRYVNIPVVFSQPGQAELEKFLILMHSIGDEKLHIHCAANWRVSAFYSIFAVQSGRWDLTQAQRFITDIWNPTEHPAWHQLLREYGIDIE